MPLRAHGLVILGILASGCMDQQQAEQTAKKVADEAGPALDKGREVVAEGMDKAKPHIEKGAAAVVDETKSLFADIPETGELSEASQGWLEAAASAGEGIEQLVAKGTQLAPVALEIGKVLDESVDKDYAIEPIYQSLGDEAAQAALDEKLAKMPKTQEIDGVEVGFKRLTEVSSEKKVDESAYLVLWRRDGHLVGFIYRTRSEIDVDELARQAPRLIGLVNGALDGAH